MAEEEAIRTGGCQCGAVRYEIANAPVELYVCHCRECKKQSSSAFGISAIFRRSDFRLTQGAVKSWTRDADSGGRVKCNFCPDCGSRLWHEDGDALETTVSIKAGSLDRPIDLTNAVHIWTSRRLPGVIIPEGATQSPQEPDPAKLAD